MRKRRSALEIMRRLVASSITPPLISSRYPCFVSFCFALCTAADEKATSSTFRVRASPSGETRTEVNANILKTYCDIIPVN